MNLIKFAAVLVSSTLLMACANLEQLGEEMGFAAESSNRHASADKPMKKSQTKWGTAAANRPAISAVPQAQKVAVRTTTSSKRINTTNANACADSDDWYLDGYRVGKSFRTQKNQMLQQRSSYCGLSLNQLPDEYRNNWERGFRIGTKS